MRKSIEYLTFWIDANIIALGREMRLSYLPPLMVYMAAGISGLTAIVGTFFIKEHLGLSAEFLAVLGFWAGIPWMLKMPVGHLVDLIWRWKGLLVFFGAGLIAASIAIMVGLLGYTDFMRTFASVETWFVASALLAPIGYVLQDVVADAMTVEAVPPRDANGAPLDPATKRLMHTTMQTLGRVAIIGGGVMVAALNIFVFRDIASMTAAEIQNAYLSVYLYAFFIPIVSIAGVVFAYLLKRNTIRTLVRRGVSDVDARAMIEVKTDTTSPDWWILGGGFAFALVALLVGLSGMTYGEEIIFALSFGIIVFLIGKLISHLDASSRNVLVGTAVIIFIYRATPGVGEGANWWMIDVLKFDQQFFSVLSLIGSSLALLGMFIFRRFIAEKSIMYIVGFLTIAGTVLSLPTIGMYYGLHEWTAALTNGVVNARFIAIVDTMLASPLGQVAMIPMLAWIANSAPAHLKATFFAVMASFTNLALSASQLGTKYLNQIYIVTREVRDANGAIAIPANYSELGMLLATAIIIGLVLPFAAMYAVHKLKLRSA